MSVRFKNFILRLVVELKITKYKRTSTTTMSILIAYTLLYHTGHARDTHTLPHFELTMERKIIMFKAQDLL